MKKDALNILYCSCICILLFGSTITTAVGSLQTVVKSQFLESSDVISLDKQVDTTVSNVKNSIDVSENDQCSIAETSMKSSITQYGISWTFDQEYPCGQFVTGDWWVVGPVTITSISPGASGGRDGSMINPLPGDDQAYDDRNGGYTSELVITAPVSLNLGESLVSTVSLSSSEYPYADVIGYDVQSNAGFTKSAAILTCLASAPADDAFRPAYVGSDKTLYYTSQLCYDHLPSLAAPSSTLSLATYERIFERPWIDHMADWLSRAMHPADNMPNYGREVCGVVGDAACLVCLNYTQAQKEKIVIGLVQIGIDNYHSALLNQHLWPLAGGHTIGRKLPILFAGLLLDEQSMLDLQGYDVSEDMSTYYGNSEHELWTGWQNSDHEYATPAMYLFEEGADIYGNTWFHENRHPSTWSDSPFPNNGNQYPYNKHESYKRICSFAFPGQTIAALLLGLKESWNHSAYFDYVDRWMYEDDATNFEIIKQYCPSFTGPYDGGTAFSTFARDMYLTYRSQCTSTINTPPNAPDAPTGPTSGLCSIEYNYCAQITDPDDDAIQYGWDWDGDEQVDAWTSFVSSGDQITTSHAWEEPGTYLVQVKARDESGDESSWSESLTVTIAMLGDMNLDGDVNLFDIDLFVLAIIRPTVFIDQYGLFRFNLGDCNQDGSVDLFDIDMFVEVLSR